jgi:hypothetical protein
MTKATKTLDDDMPTEIDFSKGRRGKFFRPGTKLNLPVYLDDQVQSRLAALANAKGVDFSALVNDLLKKDIELIEMAR